MSDELTEEEKKTLEQIEERFFEVFRWFFKTPKTVEQEEE